MATFPKELKPIYVDNNDLIRLGSIDDGGYVVPIKTIMNSRSLVSFGISDNWDFEKDFIKKSKVNVFGYDHSIDNNFWLSRFKRDLIKFLQTNLACKVFYLHTDLLNFFSLLQYVLMYLNLKLKHHYLKF